MKNSNFILESKNDILEFEKSSMRLVSFRPKVAMEQEFIVSKPEHPVFVIQYLDEERQYQRLVSNQAASITVSMETNADQSVLTAVYNKISGLDLEVTARVSASTSAPYSRWGLTVCNNAGIDIVDVQYPFVVCPYDLGGQKKGEKLLLPFNFSKLIPSPTKEIIGPDCMDVWTVTRESGCYGIYKTYSTWNHYPGLQFAQFISYYNDRAGLYFACEDTEGHIKRIRAVHHDPGIRLGIAHIGDWPKNGERKLEYKIVLGSFTGDWYTAAEMYRDWSLGQKWAKPLCKRTDIPSWLLDSTPYIAIRPQGIDDSAPVIPINEFLPYEKCFPLLENVSERVESPITAVFMGWERGGSWVYPDSLPPIGGDESMKNFTMFARSKGWHVGAFNNGTRWVVGHNWNGYDGRSYFKEHDGDKSVCRLPDGNAWMDYWDHSWRPSYPCCIGSKTTREIAKSFVKHMVGWGFESIQFFDQNNGATTFACFAEDHEHPPMPGKWMTEKMGEFAAELHNTAVSTGEKEVILSVEACVNDQCLQLFQETDVRAVPEGHYTGDVLTEYAVPLYQFLFHECIIQHGMMSRGPEPYHVQIANAMNGVLGEIPGGVLTGDGTLLDKDTWNWAEWEPKVGNPDDGLEMIRNVTALRRGAGKDYLVYGRMMRPAKAEHINIVKWDYNGRRHEIPAVFHSAWQTLDGRFSIALANWTNEEQSLCLQDFRLDNMVVEHIFAKATIQKQRIVLENRLDIKLPALSMALIENVKNLI